MLTFLQGTTHLNQVIGLLLAHSADFDMLSASLQGIPSITRRELEKVVLDVQLKVRTPQERAFWKAVDRGCKLKTN